MPALGVFIKLFEKPEIRTIGIALQPIFQAVAQVALNIFDGSKGRSSLRKRTFHGSDSHCSCFTLDGDDLLV